MLTLSRMSLTWDGDRNLFIRLMDAYLQEVCPPEECRREQANLRNADLTAGLIRQACRRRDPYFLMRIQQDESCIGLITYALNEAQAEGCIRSLFILPEHRRRGCGSEAYRQAEAHLRRLGARQIALEPVSAAAPFWQRLGFAEDGASWRKAMPHRKGSDDVKLLYYTRTPVKEDDLYAPRLAYSLHLALVEDDLTCTPLLHNSGVVYARAQHGEQNLLHPYSLRTPWMTRLPGGEWAVVARRVEADGETDPLSEDHVLLFTSTDLIHYTEQPLLHISDPLAQEYLACIHAAPPALPDGLLLPEGAEDCRMVIITAQEAERLRIRFTVPVNVENLVPQRVKASELSSVRATACYSDGTTVEKRVDWRLHGLDLTSPGEYRITGRIRQHRFEFPFAWNKADPAVCRWEGKYYFISTNDLDGNRTLFIREADTLPELENAQQVCILDGDTYPHLTNLLWAPELHVIGNRLYCFHAGTPGPFIQEQSHVMALKEGGDPLKAADWEMSRRVVRRDGSMLYGPEGITLDQTVFWSGQRLYTAWSQRQFSPVDLGAWLYVAELDPDKPWQLLSEPQVLTVPEYGWENNHTFVVEGPFALYRDGRILLTYSGALVDHTYCVGLLSMAYGADPLDPASWTKENYPLLTSRSVAGEYGPGHNAYVTDEDGMVWNTYHARPGVKGPRSSGVRRVHFAADGHPVLDMTEEMDLKPELAFVETTVVVD